MGSQREKKKFGKLIHFYVNSLHYVPLYVTVNCYFILMFSFVHLCRTMEHEQAVRDAICEPLDERQIRINQQLAQCSTTTDVRLRLFKRREFIPYYFDTLTVIN
jgi:hypothetical protein